MKSVSNILSITMAVVLTAKLVNADLMTRFIFTANGSCDSDETDLIEEVFGPDAVSNRRVLIRENRTLGSSCAHACAGYVSGRCFATGCSSYNKRQRMLQNTIVEHRGLQTCGDVMNEIQQKLETLKDDVTRSCQDFIGDENSREVSCYDDALVSSIASAKLWKVSSSTRTLLKYSLPTSGFSFCKSTEFTIQAMIDTCVDTVEFAFTGPNGFYHDQLELSRPYTLFGDKDSIFNGRDLDDTGLYTVTITPDGDEAKKKIFTFRLVDC